MEAIPSTRRKRMWLAIAATPILLWLAQPPLAIGPLSLVSLVPWLYLASRRELGRGDYWAVWAAAAIYWLLSLQGLRFAHPWMVVPWLMLGAYLAFYSVLFVAFAHRVMVWSAWMIVLIPIGWVGLECIRNYLLTGTSLLMLGHAFAELPVMIQIADLFGSYGISFLIVMVNVALWKLLISISRRRVELATATANAAAVCALAGTFLYGRHRLGEPLGDDLATFALIQRNEPIEYGQPVERETEIFQRYAQQAAQAVAESDRSIDAVVWPESMFTGGVPWRILAAEFRVPPDSELTRGEFSRQIEASREYFRQRTAYVQDSLAARNSSGIRPDLLVGCAVIRYPERPVIHSGLIHINHDANVNDWYGKMHLVVFGEYIPILPHIPGLRSLVPLDLAVRVGPGTKKFLVGETLVAPNICIETAVERITVNHLASFLDDSPGAASADAIPEVVVTVTNDGWFDDSSVIDHHFRCAQVLAVAVRRPILSAANNGPTAWIDSCGRVIADVEQGSSGAVIATPRQDHRLSLYLQIGDWPARLCAVAAVAMLLVRRKPLAHS